MIHPAPESSPADSRNRLSIPVSYVLESICCKVEIECHRPAYFIVIGIPQTRNLYNSNVGKAFHAAARVTDVIKRLGFLFNFFVVI